MRDGLHGGVPLALVPLRPRHREPARPPRGYRLAVHPVLEVDGAWFADVGEAPDAVLVRAPAGPRPVRFGVAGASGRRRGCSGGPSGATTPPTKPPGRARRRQPGLPRPRRRAARRRRRRATADELGGGRPLGAEWAQVAAGGRPRDGGLPRRHRAVPARRHRTRRRRPAGRRARPARDRGGPGDDPPLPVDPRPRARRGRAPALRACRARCRRRAARWSRRARPCRPPTPPAPARGGRPNSSPRPNRPPPASTRRAASANGGRPPARPGPGPRGGHARHRGAPGRRGRPLRVRPASPPGGRPRPPRPTGSRPRISALRREFSEPCSLDLADAEKRRGRRSRAVDRAIAAGPRARRRRRLGRRGRRGRRGPLRSWARPSSAHDAVAGRLADLRAVRADPAKFAADTRFVLRDAQRLVVDRGLVKRLRPDPRRAVRAAAERAGPAHRRAPRLLALPQRAARRRATRAQEVVAEARTAAARARWSVLRLVADRDGARRGDLARPAAAAARAVEAPVLGLPELASRAPARRAHAGQNRGASRRCASASAANRRSHRGRSVRHPADAAAADLARPREMWIFLMVSSTGENRVEPMSQKSSANWRAAGVELVLLARQVDALVRLADRAQRVLAAATASICSRNILRSIATPMSLRPEVLGGAVGDRALRHPGHDVLALDVVGDVPAVLRRAPGSGSRGSAAARRARSRPGCARCRA